MLQNDMYSMYQPGISNTMTGLHGFPQKASLTGKIVNKENEITPNDLPADCTAGIFPLADESAIFIKRWNPDCSITTIKYVPENEVRPQINNDLSDFKEYLDVKFNTLVTAITNGGAKG